MKVPQATPDPRIKKLEDIIREQNKWFEKQNALNLELKKEIAQLRADAVLVVKFEGGDDSDELGYTQRIGIFSETELVIPAQMIRIRNVNPDGEDVAEPFVDFAPLGLPLRFKNTKFDTSTKE